MADKLIIVESPAKANTIKKFLGGRTKVVASMGHIRDLPKSKLGVNIENNFEPEYINIRGKGDLIKSLKKDAKSAKKVYLATDPDREGEAIAWHLAHLLDIPEESKSRVTFNEITKTAVQKAIKEPRQIDINLVNAQQARRVLDRIVGYKISPVLWKKVRKGLSAGRVQSVAVKLIVDRENEIESFIPEEYWNIIANLLDTKSKKKFEAKLVGKDNKKIEIHTKEEVDEILKAIANKLNTVGYMKNLKRLQVGNFNIENAICIDNLNLENIDKYVYTLEDMLKENNSIKLNEYKLKLFLNGVKLSVNNLDGIYKIYVKSSFIGTGTVKNGLLKRDIILIDNM